MRRALTIFIILLFLGACSKQKRPAISFYYWKTTFELSTLERSILQDNQVTKLYIRYFDVALKNGEALPLAPVSFKEPFGEWAIVPVVYIKNDVMLDAVIDLDKLVDNILSYVNQINASNAISCNEIQIDCDWTLRSKEKYMEFIELFKKKSGKLLSATIRLHQVKYYKGAGIPGVDKGVLMYYNMGHIASDSLNSIYDRNIAQRYLPGLTKYPLALNIALPIYSWGVHIRNKKVVSLLSKSDQTTFANDTHFIRGEGAFFKATDNIIKGGRYFQKGDIIKIESIAPETVEEMAEELQEHLGKIPDELIFYDLDDFNLKNYHDNASFFKKISHIF